MANEELRKELVDYLTKGKVRASFLEATADMPEAAMNKKMDGFLHTPWMILEHIRISQFDMVDFIRNANYKELEWPKDYWPPETQLATATLWQESVEKCQRDLEALKEIIQNPSSDLFAKIPWGTGQTIMREVLQIVDHASYHIGQLVVLRKALGVWKDN